MARAAAHPRGADQGARRRARGRPRPVAEHLRGPRPSSTTPTTHRMRMCDLASTALLSRSGLSRLADRLERDGLIARASCHDDARGSYAVLTEAGAAKLRAARATHLRGRPRAFPQPPGRRRARRARRRPGGGWAARRTRPTALSWPRPWARPLGGASRVKWLAVAGAARARHRGVACSRSPGSAPRGRAVGARPGSSASSPTTTRCSTRRRSSPSETGVMRASGVQTCASPFTGRTMQPDAGRCRSELRALLDNLRRPRSAQRRLSVLPTVLSEPRVGGAEPAASAVSPPKNPADYAALHGCSSSSATAPTARSGRPTRGCPGPDPHLADLERAEPETVLDRPALRAAVRRAAQGQPTPRSRRPTPAPRSCSAGLPEPLVDRAADALQGRRRAVLRHRRGAPVHALAARRACTSSRSTAASMAKNGDASTSRSA